MGLIGYSIDVQKEVTTAPNLPGRCCKRAKTSRQSWYLSINIWSLVKSGMMQKIHAEKFLMVVEWHPWVWFDPFERRAHIGLQWLGAVPLSIGMTKKGQDNIPRQVLKGSWECRLQDLWGCFYLAWKKRVVSTAAQAEFLVSRHVIQSSYRSQYAITGWVWGRKKRTEWVGHPHQSPYRFHRHQNLLHLEERHLQSRFAYWYLLSL